MKVKELKAGMLLRFKEERIYKFMHDSGELNWVDFGKIDPQQLLYGFKVGQPLMIYLGQEKYPPGTHYGGFKKVRKVSVDGQIAAVFPDAWKYVEAL